MHINGPETNFEGEPASPGFERTFWRTVIVVNILYIAFWIFIGYSIAQNVAG